MVNIKLDSQISLTSDSKQFMLEKEGRAFSFHSTLESAIESYFELKIRSSDSKSIHSLLSYHKLLRAGLCKALVPLQIEVITSQSHSDKHQLDTNGQTKPLPSHDGKEVANASDNSKVALLQPITQSNKQEVLKF